jgi:hypothetical protein
LGRDQDYIMPNPLAFFSVLLADALFALVALLWFAPDRRSGRALGI